MRLFNSASVSKLALVSALPSLWGETSDQVAQRSRTLLSDGQNFGVGILSTTFHQDYIDEGLRGMVTSGPEYFAPCYDNGDLLMIAMPVSQNWRNALSTPMHNATLSISSSADPTVPDPRHASKHGRKHKWDHTRPSWRRGMPSKQRLTLFGHVERIDGNLAEDEGLAACYVAHHPDAKHWAPGSQESPHVAFWSRFVVERVYRVGGFGDEASIGWVDMDKWREVKGDRTNEESHTPALVLQQ